MSKTLLTLPTNIWLFYQTQTREIKYFILSLKLMWLINKIFFIFQSKLWREQKRSVRVTVKQKKDGPDQRYDADQGLPARRSRLVRPRRWICPTRRGRRIPQSCTGRTYMKTVKVLFNPVLLRGLVVSNFWVVKTCKIQYEPLNVITFG